MLALNYSLIDSLTVAETQVKSSSTKSYRDLRSNCI